LKKKEIVVVTVKMPKTLKDLTEEHIQKDTHQNLSEFIRDAIRQKIQREAPELYAELFKVQKT